GESQIETLVTRRCLAEALWNDGSTDEAELLLEDTLKLCYEVAGANGDLSLQVKELKARILCAKGGLSEAKDLAAETMEVCEQEFGKSDTLTMLSVRTWMDICSRSGKTHNLITWYGKSNL